jgi:hypothetical protein
LVLATLIALYAARRRSAAAAGLAPRLIDAYAKSWLHDAMSVAESPGAITADAGAR